MKKFILIIRYLLYSIILFFIVEKAAYAQVQEGTCLYDNGCFLIEYEKVTIDASGNPQTATIVFNTFLNEVAGCPTIEYITITPTFRNNQFRFNRDRLLTGQPISVTINNSAFNNRVNIIVNYVGTGGVDNIELIYDPETQCLDPQPVELSSFTGLPTQSGISLNWSTASEANNSHFEIERSPNGQAFEHIAKVDGNGNSSVAINYTYLDTSPLQGTNYYRLKQVDFDGQFAYSNMIAVSNDRQSAMQVTMAPNPCRNGNCEVLIRNSRETRQTLLELKDMSGKVVLTKMVQSGAVQLTPEELRQYKGLFILTATSGNEVVHQRVILE